MLTKDLAKFRVRDGKAFPSFLSDDQAKVRDLAACLIQLGQKMESSTVEEFLDSLQTEADSTLPYYKGLLKVYLGENEGEVPDDCSQNRRRYLDMSERLRKEANGDFDRFRSLMSDQTSEDFSEISNKIYSDLPEYAQIKPPNNLKVEDLIGQYNRALIKGILSTSSYLKIQLETKAAETTSELRKILRAVRFHRLILEKIEEENHVKESHDRKNIALTISGPLSICTSGTAYGFRLAQFVHHILDLPQWKIHSDISFKGAILTLDIQSEKANFGKKSTSSPYIPPEYSALQGTHLIKDKSLEISIEADIVVLCGVAVVPDFRVTMDRKVMFLEIFHKWHRSSLKTRLKDPQELVKKNFMIAIEKSLSKNQEFVEIIENAKKAGVALLEFRDFPTVKGISEIFRNSSNCLPEAANLKPLKEKTEPTPERGMQ